MSNAMTANSGRMAIVLIGLVLVWGIFASKAEGAADWYVCAVDQTGIGFDRVYVKLTDTAAQPTFVMKWTWAGNDITVANRILSTALTAVNGDKLVLVYVDASQKYPALKAFYIIS